MSSLANFNFSSSAVNKILKHTKNYGNTDCTCTMYHSHHKDAPRHEVVKSENALHTFNLHIRGKKVSASNLASARLHMNAATGNVVATTPPPISVTNTHTHCICPYSSGTYNNHLDVRVDETGSVHNITTTKKSLLGDTLGETTDNGLKFQPNHANQPEYGIGFIDWVLPVCFAPYDTSESNYFWGGGTPSCNDPGCTATFDACVAQWGAGSENACQDCQMTIGGSPGCILQTNDDGKGIYGTQPAPIGNLWTIRDKNGIIRYYADASANVFFSWSTVPQGPVTPSTEAFVIGKNGVTVGPVGNCSPHKKKDMLTETELTNTTCSVHGSSGHYINDSSGIATKYCCKAWTDPSGCTSGSTDDVCLDNTSHNTGSDECLKVRFSLIDCSSSPAPPEPPGDEPIECHLQDCTACPGGAGCTGTAGKLEYWVYTSGTTRYMTDLGVLSTTRPDIFRTGTFAPFTGHGQGDDATSMFLRFEGEDDYDIRPSGWSGTKAGRPPKLALPLICGKGALGKPVGQLFKEELESSLKPTKENVVAFANKLNCSWTGANIGQGLGTDASDVHSALYTFAWKCYKLFSAYAGVGTTTDASMGPWDGPSSKLWPTARPATSYSRFLFDPAKLKDVFNENLTKLFDKYPVNAKDASGTSILGTPTQAKYIMLNGAHTIYPLWKLQQYGCLGGMGQSTCNSPYLVGVCSLIRVTDPDTSNNFYFINMGTEMNDAHATGWSHETSTCYEIGDLIKYASTTYFPGGINDSGNVNVSVYPLTFKSMPGVDDPAYGPTWGNYPGKNTDV